MHPIEVYFCTSTVYIPTPSGMFTCSFLSSQHPILLETPCSSVLLRFDLFKIARDEWQRNAQIKEHSKTVYSMSNWSPSYIDTLDASDQGREGKNENSCRPKGFLVSIVTELERDQISTDVEGT